MAKIRLVNRDETYSVSTDTGTKTTPSDASVKDEFVRFAELAKGLVKVSKDDLDDARGKSA